MDQEVWGSTPYERAICLFYSPLKRLVRDANGLFLIKNSRSLETNKLAPRNVRFLQWGTCRLDD